MATVLYNHEKNVMMEILITKMHVTITVSSPTVVMVFKIKVKHVTTVIFPMEIAVTTHVSSLIVVMGFGSHKMVLVVDDFSVSETSNVTMELTMAKMVFVVRPVCS